MSIHDDAFNTSADSSAECGLRLRSEGVTSSPAYVEDLQDDVALLNSSGDSTNVEIIECLDDSGIGETPEKPIIKTCVDPPQIQGPTNFANYFNK
ncbi:unnamed protein product [Leptidea sinapis]|uniref:Uncharacterized protein n=1 Tax=Leptidea sinapis TaxID=189913 RepID=A0A5E4QND0_9NEOP|nr:unnamed protein product [Leptidea sinapis]